MNPPRSRLLWIGIPGPDVPAPDAFPEPGGVVLFGRNLDPDPASGPERCHTLTQELQARWGALAPLVVAIDQEGGRVSRLQPWVGETPSLHESWCTGGARACAAWGRLWGEGLGLLGINTDFAPVADLYSEGGAMGERSASDLPIEAARAAGAFLHGLEGAGVRGCLKHFPGLGGTRLDSHVGLPERGEADEMDGHLMAFRMLAHADRLVMVAHLKTPWSGDLPASLHPSHAAQNPWGVRGRWITDDLEMGGVASWDWKERIRLAVEAGHEALLVCQTEAAVQAAAEALNEIPVPADPRPVLPLAGGRPGANFDRQGWDRWVEKIRAAASPA